MIQVKDFYEKDYTQSCGHSPLFSNDPFVHNSCYAHDLFTQIFKKWAQQKFLFEEKIFNILWELIFFINK